MAGRKLRWERAKKRPVDVEAEDQRKSASRRADKILAADDLKRLNATMPAQERQSKRKVPSEASAYQRNRSGWPKYVTRGPLGPSGLQVFVLRDPEHAVQLGFGWICQ